MSAGAPEVELLGSIENNTAPRRILEFAARGFVPMAPSDLVRAICSILATGDPELGSLAEETFKGFDGPALLGAVMSEGVRPEQLDGIARRSSDPQVLEPIIRHRAVPNDTLAWLAYRISPEMQDVLVTNQARLLEAPVIVERLFENPHLSSDIRRRADEFLEEFFLKKERERDAEELDVDLPGEELAVEPGTPGTAAEQPADGTPEAAPEAENENLLVRLSSLKVSERVRVAFRGTREERLFLIRDNNRLVSTAVLKSPKTNEADAEVIAKMTSVSEDVLRAISQRRDWMKKYSILWAIMRNPRTPIDVTMPLVARLGAREQVILSTDRNVPEGVRVTARRIVSRRQT